MTTFLAEQLRRNAARDPGHAAAVEMLLASYGGLFAERNCPWVVPAGGAMGVDFQLITEQTCAGLSDGQRAFLQTVWNVAVGPLSLIVCNLSTSGRRLLLQRIAAGSVVTAALRVTAAADSQLPTDLQLRTVIPAVAPRSR